MKIFSLLPALMMLLSLVPLESRAEVGSSSLRRAFVEARAASLDGKKVRKSASTNFSGGWHGALVLARASCPGFSSSFGFRHIASLSGNRVVLRTTHDGTLTGMTRDKGRRLEAGRQYFVNGARFTSVVVYGALNSNSVRIGMSISISKGGRTCSAVYGGNGVRAF